MVRGKHAPESELAAGQSLAAHQGAEHGGARRIADQGGDLDHIGSGDHGGFYRSRRASGNRRRFGTCRTDGRRRAAELLRRSCLPKQKPQGTAMKRQTVRVEPLSTYNEPAKCRSRRRSGAATLSSCRIFRPMTRPPARSSASRSSAKPRSVLEQIKLCLAAGALPSTTYQVQCVLHRRQAFRGDQHRLRAIFPSTTRRHAASSASCPGTARSTSKSIASRGCNENLVRP